MKDQVQTQGNIVKPKRIVTKTLMGKHLACDDFLVFSENDLISASRKLSCTRHVSLRKILAKYDKEIASD